MFKQKKNHKFKTRYENKYEKVIYDKPPKKVKYDTYPSIVAPYRVYIVYYFLGTEPYTWPMRYYRHIRTTNEKRQWYDYMDQLKDNGLVLHRNRRSDHSLPDYFEDIYVGSNEEHKRSWKAHTKCKKQWMKNLKD